MSKYKTQRPEDKWESSQPAEKRPAERKRRERQSSRSQKVQASNHGLSTSEANFQSDALGPMDYDWPTQAAEGSQHQVYSGGTDQEREDASKRQRASSVRPGNNARALTSDVASAALQRAIQSSPARWAGTRHSPIQLEDDLGSTRRLLFPSPRKEGSTDVLGEVAINTVQPATRFHSLTYTKCQASDKENCRPLPLFDGADDDLIKLFEEVLTRPSRPTTPIRKSSPNKLFKTPTRQTPSHRPLTRSQSKSARLAHKIQMLPQRTPSKTPSTAARRRSPRNHQRNFESPLTATLNMLLDEPVDTHNTINESPSRHLDLGLDFANLPDLGHSTSNGTHCDALTFHLPGFDPNHDFFSTDVPMPSSPPRLFDLYEDPLAMGMHSLDNLNNAMWSDFQMDESSLHTFGAGFVVDAGGHATFEMGTMNGDSTVRIKLEALSSEEIDHQVTQPKKQLQNA